MQLNNHPRFSITYSQLNVMSQELLQQLQLQLDQYKEEKRLREEEKRRRDEAKEEKQRQKDEKYYQWTGLRIRRGAWWQMVGRLHGIAPFL